MIVVTTPTGEIGRKVLQSVLQGSEPIRVIARDPSRIPREMRQRVEVVQGSHGDAATIEKALIGADALFWLIPPEPLMSSDDAGQAYVDFTKPAAAAINQCGVKRVVAVSAIGRDWTRSGGLATANIKADDLLASTDVALRVLAMPSFMENFKRQAHSIKEKGMFFTPLQADLKVPIVATDDIASVAAAFLVDSSWTGQADVPLLGPEDLSQNELAEILSDVLGKIVRCQQVPIEAFKSMMGSRASQSFAQGLADMMTAKNEGMDNTASRELAPNTPTTFRRWSETVLKPLVLD